MGRSGIADPLQSRKESERSGHRVEIVLGFMGYSYRGQALGEPVLLVFLFPTVLETRAGVDA